MTSMMNMRANNLDFLNKSFEILTNIDLQNCLPCTTSGEWI